MASIQFHLDHSSQLRIEDVDWPLVLRLEEGSTVAVNGTSRELAAWARTFASRLAAKADELDERAAQSERDLADSRAEVEAIRAAKS